MKNGPITKVSQRPSLDVVVLVNKEYCKYHCFQQLHCIQEFYHYPKK